MLRLLSRLLYLPFFLIFGNGLAVYIVDAGLPKIWLIALALSFIALAFFLEWWVPYDANFNNSQGDRMRDFCHAIINEGANIVGIASLPLMASLITWPSIWPAHLPLWTQLLIAVFLADIGITLVHYYSHRFEALWKLHAVHHSVKRMYGFNGLMKHPLHQFLETLAGVTPLVLMGIPPETLSLLIIAVVLQLLLQHSNVAYYVGPLRHILAVNVIHRFHHLKTAEEGDVNFGLFTTLTDYLLGTCYYDKDRIFGTGDLGIAAQPNYPIAYFDQIREPFRQ